MSKLKAVIIPGNENTDISENWFPYVKKELQKHGFSVSARNMPDPKLARKKFWLPFIINELKADKNTVAIGHSSGAVAILRLLETNKLLGAVIVGACYTDLGDEMEKKSGYYDDPWRWKKIKENTGWIVQFASQGDPYIPITEPRYIHEKLNCEYHEYTDQGHFDADVGKKEFPELVEVILRKTKKSKNQF